MKTDTKIGFIITYFHTSNEGYELLKKNIEILSGENYYLVVASHSPLDKEIQEMCDYYFYQQKNIVDDRKYSHGVAESNLIEISLNHLKLQNIDWTYKVSYDIEINNMERFIDWRKDYKFDFVSCIWGSNIICTNSFFSNIDFLLNNITFYRDIESMFAVNNVLENCWEYDIRRKNLVDRTFAFENKYVFYGDNKIDILFYDYDQIDFWCDNEKFFVVNNSIDKPSLDIKIFDYYTDLCIYENDNFTIEKDTIKFIIPKERHGDKNGFYLEVYLDELTVRKNIMIKDFDYKHESSKKFKKLKGSKLIKKEVKNEVITTSNKERKEILDMRKEIFDVEILENWNLRIKNISGQKIDAKIELFSYSYLNLIFDNFKFNIDEEKIIPISLSNFTSNDSQNNIRFRAYSNGELIQEKTIYKTYDRAYVLISNDKYEGITEKLIEGLSKYSNHQILHYTVNYESNLSYRNLTNIRFEFGDQSDQQYMQFMKGPVFIDVLEKGFKHLVFLDSDIQVRPNIDKCFDIEQTSKGPILQKQHWDYVIANGEYIPGPLVREYLELGSEPGVDFVQPHPNGITNVVIFNQSHLDVFREWQEVCFSERIQEIRKTEFLHDELLLNCLLWKNKMYSRFEYIGLNVVDDKDVNFFYNIPNLIGKPFFNLNDYDMGHRAQSYMPHDKNDILFFHCVKDVNVADKINKVIEDREILKNESEEYFRSKLIDFYSDITTNKNRLLEIKPSFNFNFIDGPLFEVKNAGTKRFNVKFIDKKTNNILHVGNIGNNNWIRCNFMYYIDWRIQLEYDSEVFNYDIDLEGKRVFINFESSALGDNLAWIPYVDEFRKKHNCKVICSTFWNKFFEDEYQEIEFVSPGSVVHNLAAMYRIGWFYNGDADSINYSKVPNNFRLQPMQKTCSDILGLEYKEIIPKIKMNKNVQKEKMIAIAIHGTAQTKYWNNPEGWQKLVDHLKSIGYKVVLVSKENDGYMGNSHPTGIEKLPAGDIEGVMDVIQRSEMFIGIGSGLSWLSWALGTKTVLISGFSYDYTEPSMNTIRIKTPQGKCTGCFNTHKLDPGDWNWCPLHKGTERQFECSKSITPEQVIEEITKHLEKSEYISNEFIF